MLETDARVFSAGSTHSRGGHTPSQIVVLHRIVVGVRVEREHHDTVRPRMSPRKVDSYLYSPAGMKATCVSHDIPCSGMEKFECRFWFMVKV